MRRFLLLVLMFVLPLQWAGAVVASVCEHEEQAAAGAHVGHHTHEHHGPELPSPAPDDADADAAAAEHPDCGVCHGIGTPVVGADAVSTFARDRQGRFAPYRATVPDRSPDALLRPPLPPVA